MINTFRKIFLLFAGVFATLNLYSNQGVKFIENKGQWENFILYRADIPSGKLFVQQNKLTYYFYDSDQLDSMHHFRQTEYLNCHSFEVEFIDADFLGKITPSIETQEYYNYFNSNDKSRWVSGVKGYGRLLIREIYPGIDMELLSIDGAIKYNFILKAGVDPSIIKLKYTGQDKIYLKNDELHILTTVNHIKEILPEVYQNQKGSKLNVDCNFTLEDDILQFEFPNYYDDRLPIIIDPVVIFSSYSGSVADNFGYTATYDDSGYAYSAGTVFDPGFPVTKGAFQLKFKGGVTGNVYGSGNERDVGILKYKPDGTSLVYATYLGGIGNEDPHSLVVDKNYNLIVFGSTCSKNFPIGKTFYDSSFNGEYDIYLAKFSTDGKKLLASTFIGGDKEDGLNGYYTIPFTNRYNQSFLGFNYGDSYRGEVVVNNKNQIVVATTTKSTNFPVTSGAFQSGYGGGDQDACVFSFNNTIDTLLGSSYIGGSEDDAGYGLAIRSDDDFYVCGGTRSTNLPVSVSKYQPSYQGGNADGFIYYVSKDFNSKKAATYFGTSKYDQVYFVQTDLKDFVYVTGQTTSDNFPVKNVKYYNAKGKMFLTKLNPDLDSLVYSTVFGTGSANPNLSPSAFLVDYCERVYFSGWGGELNNDWSRNTGSFTTGLPTTVDAFYKTTDGSDFYLAVFSKDIQSLLFATFFGGDLSSDHVDGGTSRFDKNGIVYQSVCASCGGFYNDFPTYPYNVHSDSNKSYNCNNAIFKINLDIPDLFADFNADTIFCIADSTNIINTSKGASKYYWDFGVPNRTNDTSTAFQPRFNYPDTGLFKVTLIASNVNSCDQSDTVSKIIRVYNQAESDFKMVNLECVNHVVFEAITEYGTKYYWNFGEKTSKYNESNDRRANHVYQDTGVYYVTLIVDSGTVCQSTIIKKIYIPPLPKAKFDFTMDTCGGKVFFTNLSERTKHYYWDYGDLMTSNDTNHLHTHSYFKADTFQIVLISEPYSECSDTAEKTLIIVTPQANIVMNIDTCSWLVTFINPSNYALKASKWYFGDGNDSSFIDTVKDYHYTSDGNFEVTLIANLNTICVDTVKETFDLFPLPLADFIIEKQDCEKDVKFTNKSVNSYKFKWDLGNGQTSVSKDSFIIHYTTSGNYIVKLEAQSNIGCIDTLIDTIKIDHLAVADFNLKWDTCTNRIKVINNSSKGGLFFWNFGDGTTSNNPKDSFYYFLDTTGIYKDTSKMYNVQLYVVDPPCSDTLIKQVKVYLQPEIEFEALFDKCSPIVDLKSIANGARSYYWDLGDGDSSNTKDIVHEYVNSGTFKVILTINRYDICSKTIEKILNIGKYQPEKIEIPNIFTPNGDGVNDIFSLKGLNYDCDKYLFIIFNRWGQEVFRSSEENFYWDGFINKIQASEGTYYYVFESSHYNTAGTITLVR